MDCRRACSASTTIGGKFADSISISNTVLTVDSTSPLEFLSCAVRTISKSPDFSTIAVGCRTIRLPTCSTSMPVPAKLCVSFVLTRLWSLSLKRPSMSSSTPSNAAPFTIFGSLSSLSSAASSTVSLTVSLLLTTVSGAKLSLFGVLSVMTGRRLGSLMFSPDATRRSTSWFAA